MRGEVRTRPSFQLLTRRTFLAATLAAAVPATTGCNVWDAESDGQGSTGDGVLRQSMVPVTKLDPAISGGAGAGQILNAALMEGLLVLDATGTDVLPGAAESWTVSEDGLVYTFAMRSEAMWSNGDAVTAHDFVWNWQRLLSPTTATGENRPSYAAEARVAGALAFLNGETEDFGDVGVRAVDESTFEIRLDEPNPDFLFLLASWWTLPLHPATVKEHPTDWAEAENWVSNGAFVLQSWRPNASAVLVPNENYWDRDSYHLSRWDVQFSDGGITADVLAFQADEIDVCRVEGDTSLITDDPELRQDLVGSPRNQVRYLHLMASHNPALQDVRVRQALSLAIDREQLARVAQPDTAGGSLVPDGIPGYDQVPATVHDIERARTLLAEAGYPGGKGMPAITFLIYQRIAWIEAIGEMWRTELGVETTIDAVEIGVYSTKRYEVHPESYTGFFYRNFGVNPPTLLAAVTSGVVGLERRMLGSAMVPEAAEEFRRIEADETISPEQQAAKLEALAEANLYPEFDRYRALASQARSESDRSRREKLLVEAAIAREEVYVMIPVLWGGYNLLVKPRVTNLRPWSDSTLFTTRGVEVEA